MVYQRKETTRERLPFWKRLKISELGIRIVLVAIILVGGLTYLVLTATTATGGLQVKDLSDRLEALSQQRASLQAEADRLQSFRNLEASTQQLDLVRVGSIDYVAGSAGSVASR